MPFFTSLFTIKTQKVMSFFFYWLLWKYIRAQLQLWKLFDWKARMAISCSVLKNSEITNLSRNRLNIHKRENISTWICISNCGTHCHRIFYRVKQWGSQLLALHYEINQTLFIFWISLVFISLLIAWANSAISKNNDTNAVSFQLSPAVFSTL